MDFHFSDLVHFCPGACLKQSCSSLTASNELLVGAVIRVGRRRSNARPDSTPLHQLQPCIASLLNCVIESHN